MTQTSSQPQLSKTTRTAKSPAKALEVPTLLSASAVVVVSALAAARLTRFVTTDWLGEWTLVRPIKRWAAKHETAEIERRTVELAAQSSAMVAAARSVGSTYALRDEVVDTSRSEVLERYSSDDPFTWQAKLAKGLDCPFCVGFWIGAGVLAALPLLRAPLVGPLLKIAGQALALNYVVGHVSKRIDQ